MKLGVNIDHIATLRQARHESFPDPVFLAKEAVKGGATGITAHLREDRRHIQDCDVIFFSKHLKVPFNLEMSLAPAIVDFALKVRPDWVCLVPEHREELTTEGGLNLSKYQARLNLVIRKLQQKKIKVSLFVEPEIESIQLASVLMADAIEIHTGKYAAVFEKGSQKNIAFELARIRTTGFLAQRLGLLVNAGHGINYDNVSALVKSFSFNELNIGFSIVARSVVVGMQQAVFEMKKRMK
ncbi:MAG: pyridoxine 5'-phosphate synthase [Elusimicrobiota bacterium]